MNSNRKFWGAFIIALACFGVVILSSCWSMRNGESIASSTVTSTSASFPIEMAQAVRYTNVVDMLIIGSGPAGLSAAEYGARNKLKTVIIEGINPGGQLMRTSYVENWPGAPRALGAEIIAALRSQAVQFGAEFIGDIVVDVDVTHWPFVVKTESGLIIHALSIIVATGANPRTLGVPGEQEYWAAGVSTCAICDAAFYEDKQVIVVGGGDSAIEETMQLLPHVAHVTLLVRKNYLRAAPSMQERLKGSDKITIMYNTEIEQIIGDGTHVTGVRAYNNISGQAQDIPIDGIFLAIGHIPNTSIFKDKLVMDEEGYILVNPPSQKTSVSGIFAAGDVEDRHYRQAGVAAGAGIKAALDACAFLTEHGFNETIAQQIDDADVYLDVHADEPAVVTHVSSLEDLQTLLATNERVAIDFYAPYCSSCMAMMPRFAALSRTMPTVIFVKVDIDKAPAIKKAFGITSIPHMRLYKQGQLIASTNDVMSKKELAAFLKAVL